MQRLMCLLALCLVWPALAQPIVASAATKRVQQRVQQLLERGSRLTPESLLTSSRHLSAAAASSAGPISPASSSKVSIASVGATQPSEAAAAVASAAKPAAAEPQQAELQGAVDVAGKEVQIKWAVKQSGTVKVETDDDSEDGYMHAQEAAEELLKSGRLFPTPAGNSGVEYVHVVPSPKEHHTEHGSDHETHKHRHEDSYKGDREEKYEHRARPEDEQHSRESDSDSYKGDESELIQRLTQVDWQAVFEAAQREAEAEEAAAVEKLKVGSTARKVALQKRLDAAEAERRQADAERQQAEEERQKVQHIRKKTLEKLQDAEELRQRLEEQRQQAADELEKLAAAKRKAAEDRQQAEAVRRRAVEEAEEVKRHAAKQAETVKGIVTDEVERLAIAKQKAAERHAEAVKRRAEEVLSEAEAVKRHALKYAETTRDTAAEEIERLAIAKHKAAEAHAKAVKLRAEQEAEAVKRRAAEEAESAKDDAVDELKKLAAAKRRAAEQQADAVKRRAAEEADAIKQRATEEAKRAKPTDIRHKYDDHSKHYKDEHEDEHYKSSKDDYNPRKSDFKEYSEKEDGYGYEVDDEPAHRTKVVVQEKGRSPLRYFPGGGIYSFTSELTCATDEEYRGKVANKGFLPMITPRMKTITAGMCEWTVAEVSPTQVKRNSFLLGNAWGACTFLPIANKECPKPIVGGLSFTVQGLLYQFAQPKGIRGYEEDTIEYEGETFVTEAKTQSATNAAKSATNAGSTTTAATASEGTAKTPAAGATVSIASAETASAAATAAAAATKASAVSIAAKGSSNATAATAAAAAPTKAINSRNGKYLMDVELQNVIIGLITGAYGPKKAHKYKQGAVQFAFGPPPDTDGKAYAIETRLPPTILGGPSLEELQEGMTQLVPGTYQIVFDDDY